MFINREAGEIIYLVASVHGRSLSVLSRLNSGQQKEDLLNTGQKQL